MENIDIKALFDAVIAKLVAFLEEILGKEIPYFSEIIK